MVEQYVCRNAEGCEYSECAHRVPHDLDDDSCRAPKGHDKTAYCGLMPETRCVPVSQLEEAAKKS